MHVSELQAWESKRGDLDELPAPQKAVCLGKAFNLELASRGFPVREAYEVRKSFAETADRMLGCTALSSVSPPVGVGTRSTGINGIQGPARWRADGSSPRPCRGEAYTSRLCNAKPVEMEWPLGSARDAIRWNASWVDSPFRRK
jgi:hypothetical protein